MNGTIDLSDDRHGNADTRRHDDDLCPLEDWDEKWSDSTSSCSCSSCSTCSLCDLCVFDDYDDSNNIHKDTGACSLEGKMCSLSLSTEKNEPNQKAATLKHFDSFNDFEYSSSTVDTTRGKMRALSVRNEKKTAVHRRDGHFVHMNNHALKPSARDAYDDESGISMYSSGSDKETSINSNHTQSSGESSGDMSMSLPPNQKRVKHKRVTFLESSIDSGGFVNEKGKSGIKKESSHYVTSKHKGCRSRGDSITRCDPNIDLECKRLESILEYIDPYKLHSIMKHQLRKKNTHAILAMGELLPKRKFSGETIHCVRCHKEYSPQFDKKDCFLDHPRNQLIVTHQKDKTAYIRCTACKKEYWVQQQDDINSINIGHCYVGKHTSSLDVDAYFPYGAAESCEDRGCIEFYV